MTTLRERLYTAISKPPCDRCQSRPDWHPTDCDKHNCHALYAQEVDAVMEIVIEQRVKGFEDFHDSLQESSQEISEDTRQPVSVRQFLATLAKDCKRGKVEALKKYKEHLIGELL